MVRINSSFLMLPVRFLRQGVADLVVIGESSALTRNQFWRWSHYLNKLSLNHPLGCYIWRNDGFKRESSGLSLVPQWCYMTIMTKAESYLEGTSEPQLLGWFFRSSCVYIGFRHIVDMFWKQKIPQWHRFHQFWFASTGRLQLSWRSQTSKLSDKWSAFRGGW